MKTLKIISLYDFFSFFICNFNFFFFLKLLLQNKVMSLKWKYLVAKTENTMKITYILIIHKKNLIAMHYQHYEKLENFPLINKNNFLLFYDLLEYLCCLLRRSAHIFYIRNGIFSLCINNNIFHKFWNTDGRPSMSELRLNPDKWCMQS